MRSLCLAAWVVAASATCDSEDIACFVGALESNSGGCPTGCPADPRDSAVSVTQVTSTSVSVTVTGAVPTYVWIVDEDGYIYALSGTSPTYTFSGGTETFNLRTCNDDYTNCLAAMPSYFQVYSQWADEYRVSTISVPSWDTQIADYQGSDPQAAPGVTLTQGQFTTLNTWTPDADGSVYANRAAGGGSVQLSQPAWLAPLNTDADADGNGEADGAAFLLFVKDDAGDTLYLKEFATGTWPATDQTFGGTADMFVLGEGVTSLTACVAIPVLACDPNCPDEYTESSQKCQKFSFVTGADGVIASLQTQYAASTGALDYTEGVDVSKLSVALFEATSNGATTLRLTPPASCASVGTGAVVYACSANPCQAEDGDGVPTNLLGFAKGSVALTVPVGAADDVVVWLECDNALTTGTIGMSTLTEGKADGGVNQNNPAQPQQAPCTYGGVTYASGGTYTDAGGASCTCSNGAGMCGDAPLQEEGDSLSNNEKAVIAMCSLVLGLTLVAIAIFYLKKQRALRGRKGAGGGAYKQTEIVGPPPTTTTIGPPPGPPPGADGLKQPDLPVENV